MITHTHTHRKGSVYMSVCGCRPGCVCLTAHAGYARRAVRVDLPAGQQHVLCVTFLFMTELLFFSCYPFFPIFSRFLFYKDGLWKAIQQQLGKVLSWGKYEMFITVDKYLRTLFVFFLLISLSVSLFFFCCWQLGWHAPYGNRQQPRALPRRLHPVSLMTFPDCMFD